MIQSNELRIGNYYKWYADGKDYYFKVDSEFFNNKDVINNSEPIPLTEEILLKCNNITECDNLSYDVYKTYKILINNIEIFIEIGVECNFIYVTDGASLNINVEYLHQLQNLYYCLTGEELNIKL